METVVGVLTVAGVLLVIVILGISSSISSSGRLL